MGYTYMPMRKTIGCLAVFFVFASLLAPRAEAIRRNHRPWLMVGKARQARAPEAPKPAVAVRPSPSEPSVAREEETTPSGKQIVTKAMEYRGTRYRYGGSSKRGVDCSGLVARIFDDLKLKKVPRASSALYKVGTPVRLAELRPGDLVFFRNTYRRGISHVGIYAGSNKFVHANERFGVTVTKLSDPYYQLHYAGARRVY
jgi:cell wall-associated NlpC family hydrolase